MQGESLNQLLVSRFVDNAEEAGQLGPYYSKSIINCSASKLAFTGMRTIIFKNGMAIYNIANRLP